MYFTTGFSVCIIICIMWCILKKETTLSVPSYVHFFFLHLPSQAFYFYKKAVTSLLRGVHWKFIGLWQVDSTVTKQRHVPSERTANSRFSLNRCLNLLTCSYNASFKGRKKYKPQCCICHSNSIMWNMFGKVFLR